jgi:2-polyprenyl-3-methyl-5-hydroxy-6-metoxy-1,4-benzoquinol methylase
MKALLKALGTVPFRLMPMRVVQRVIGLGLYATSRRRPAAAVRALLDIEHVLSGYIDEAGMRYEGGIHPKHRLTRYHDFFVERVKAGERVLDVGCGYGAVAYSVATRAQAIVIGIDRDPANVAEARRRFAHPNLTFVVGDATRELPSGAFDVVLASNVIEHVEHRVEFYHAVQERVRPARWLIRVPMIDRDWRVPLRRELGLFHFSDPTHHTEYTRESFDAEVHHAGLVVAHLQINWGEIWAELRADA